MQRAMALIVRKKVHKKPTNRAIYRPNLDFECGILRGKEEAHLKGISFFSHLAGGRGFPSRPVFAGSRRMRETVFHLSRRSREFCGLKPQNN